MGRIFYIMGKSASGKDSIYKYLLGQPELKLKNVVIYTTRPIRKGEMDQKEYFFVDDSKFQELKDQGKIIESRSYNTIHGVWTYFTAADDKLKLSEYNYLGIGTLESFNCLKKYYGREKICPIYIEVEDADRLRRAIKREEKQEAPAYEEVCRRFLADSEDFSETKIREAGIEKRFLNYDRDTCLAEIEKYIKDML